MTEKKRLPIPPNWVCVDKKAKNHIYRCPVMNDSRTQQCSFTGRPNILRQHIMMNQHIFETVAMREPEKEDPNIQNEIEKLCLQLGAELQLSISQMASSSFQCFVTELIRIGGTYVMEHPREVFHPPTFFRGFSRTTITKKLIEHGDEKALQSMIKLKNFSRYIALTVDAGTICKHNLLEFLATNPCSGQKPLLLYSCEFPDHHQDCFFQALVDAISIAHEHEFDVIAIVADNVSYQRSVLAHWKLDSLINQATDPKIKSLLYIPCNCHVLNLVLTQMLKENELFKNVAYCATLLADLSRKKRYSYLFVSSAPKIPCTRWLYLFEFTEWIKKNKESIIELLSKIPSVIVNYEIHIDKFKPLTLISYQDFEKVNRLLKHLRVLNDNLEADTCNIGAVVPMVEDCASQIKKEIKSKTFENDSTPQKLLEILSARFRKTAVSDILCLAFSLTPEGRHVLSISSDHKDDDLPYYKFKNSPTYTSNPNLKDKIYPTNKVKYMTALDEYLKEIGDLNEYGSFQVYTQELESIKHKKIDFVFEQVYIKAKGALTNYVNRTKPDQTSIVVKQFCKFIRLTDPDLRKTVGQYLVEDPFNMWRALSNARICPELADYALKILSIPATEASVERLFSTIKKFLSTRQNSSNELISSYINIIHEKSSYDTMSFVSDENTDSDEQKQSDQVIEEEAEVPEPPEKKKNLQQRSLKNYYT